MHLLQVKNLSGGYHSNKNVVHNISFTVEHNDFLGIVGPNGCGKSTILKLITKVLAPQSGDSLLNGVNIKKIHLKQLYQTIAMVSQNTSLYFPISVFDFVLMGRTPFLNRLAPESQEDIAIAIEALNTTETLYLKDNDATRLSSGERQRVFIAKALAQKPIILFLDEPTAHLDIKYQIHILDLLKKLNHTQHLTIVMVMHDLNLASHYCKKLLLISGGRVVSFGTPNEVLTREIIESTYQARVNIQNDKEGKPYITPL
jgi:iron complex transport system ATP-binding protein